MEILAARGGDALFHVMEYVQKKSAIFIEFVLILRTFPESTLPDLGILTQALTKTESG
jgi:hypothetical protein